MKAVFLLTDNENGTLGVVDNGYNDFPVDWSIDAGNVSGVLPEALRTKPYALDISTRISPDFEPFRIDRDGDDNVRIQTLDANGNYYPGALNKTTVRITIIDVLEEVDFTPLGSGASEGDILQAEGFNVYFQKTSGLFPIIPTPTVTTEITIISTADLLAYLPENPVHGKTVKVMGYNLKLTFDATLGKWKCGAAN